MKQLPSILSFISILSFSTMAFATAENSTIEFMRQLANQYEAAYFEHFPEEGLMEGRKDVALDRFMDHSLQARAEWQKKEEHFLAALNNLDLNNLKSSPTHITYLLLKERLENNYGVRVCQEELWSVNPTFGWHNIMVAVAEKQPVGTPEYRMLALKRWRDFALVVSQEIKNLNFGLSQGYSAPKPAVDRVLQQLQILRTENPSDSPFFDFAKRDGDETFKKNVADIIETVINPALDHYAHYLQENYLPHARNEVGVGAIPNGVQCYHAKIKQMTTITMTPEDIYQFGLSHMQQLENEVAVIGNKIFSLQEMAAIFKQTKTNPDYLFQSEQDILNYNYAALERAKAAAPQWFDLMPKAEGIIKSYPLHRAITGASGEYHAPSEDGTQPGIFYINTYEPQKRSRVDNEATLFHELIPGHHFQVALAHEDKSHLSLDKYLWNSGYVEGWALYVERVSDEMGLYIDDISRLGMLSNEAMRTARLVVDPGIHVMNWTREQALDYLRMHTALDENIIQAEVDRYIMMPAQATSYMIGKHEINSLRQLAQTKLGDKFDIREFHNQILKNGAVTLPMLRKQVEDYYFKECSPGEAQRNPGINHAKRTSLR